MYRHTRPPFPLSGLGLTFRYYRSLCYGRCARHNALFDNRPYRYYYR